MSSSRTTPRRRMRRLVTAAAVLTAALIAPLALTSSALAVTTGNGSLVYSPAAGTSFNPEGGQPAGTTYSKMIVLKNSGSSNGTQIVTFDQLVLENGVQVYPIYRSTNNGSTWTRIAAVKPSTQFPTLTRTAQPSLYETPVQLGWMPAGTLLLSGMIMPTDRSSSRLVMYKSLDHGVTWSFVSTVDTGGPATYDPSPTSTSSTVWEPSLAVDANGGLVTYFSDERQKASNVLQAVSYRRSTDGGLTWGSLVNVSAPNNKSDRPGMITVTRLPNGNYIATFEVVNRPSQSNNTAPVYYKISPDGLTWSPTTSIGTQITLPNGRGIGSSPEVRWVPTAGNANGMIVVSSKWGLTSAGAIDGGQNFLVNRNQGSGSWEQLPYAVTYDAADTEGGTFSGFAQSFDSSADGKTLYHATNVENLSTGYNDVRVGSIPINAQQYEAESATRVDTTLVTQADAKGGTKVGNINNATSSVKFTVTAATAGTYTMNVRYDNGTTTTSTHNVSVNGGATSAVSYPPSPNWGRFRWAQLNVTLVAGSNTITFTKGTGFAELDQIQLYQP
ncbi:glycosyl hydrolase family 31 [Subtercola boreus]|uniref:Glycosyl hydrolase family 31 n=2 Tax=Subtercola boreus TaxID=120213 RepID=A0A3E0W8N1_9MICO|nr:glycosyl hydrolase family 31 [Subtercola boreus]RFA19556.1 glycosyl hydrolase family 31 [Subtercola boreus]RFA26118.1 glycosyl hydrolase family 31 [Subtercola boreus]